MSTNVHGGPDDPGSDAPAQPASQRQPRLTEVEQHGIAPIPDADRTARPIDLFRFTLGGANTLAVVVLGTFPIFIFGLSFWEGVAATLVGLVVGSLIVMPTALFGPLTGTNNAVSSGAHLGILGRIGGSFLALLTAVTFFILTLYAGGDVVVGLLDRIAGTGQPEWLFALAYAFFAIVVLVVSLYGFQLMLAVNKLSVVAASAMYVIGFVALAGDFDGGYDGAAGTDEVPFVSAFVASALLVASNPLSFGAFLGDWSRYIPRDTSPLRLMGGAFIGQIATVIPFFFGMFTSVAILSAAPEAADGGGYIVGLVQVSPGWYLVPILLIAVIAGFASGAQLLYGPGLDFSSVFPRLSRFQATAIVGTVAIAVVFIARFATDFVDTITTFATLIVVFNVPWAIVLTLGYLVRRGWYDPDGLQVFNRGQRGGIYWFTRGLNWRGMVAWLVPAGVAMLFVNLPGQFEGPLRNLAADIGISTLAGVDLSLVVALVLAVAVYLGLLWLFPEPRHVFGPHGSRWVPSRDAPVPPVKQVRPAPQAHEPPADALDPLRVGRRAAPAPTPEPEPEPVEP